MSIKQSKFIYPPRIKVTLPIFPLSDVKIIYDKYEIADWVTFTRQIKQFQMSLFLHSKDDSQFLYFSIKHIQTGILIANTVYNQLPFSIREYFKDIEALYNLITTADSSNLDVDSSGSIIIRITDKLASISEANASSLKINEVQPQC